MNTRMHIQTHACVCVHTREKIQHAKNSVHNNRKFPQSGDKTTNSKRNLLLEGTIFAVCLTSFSGMSGPSLLTGAHPVYPSLGWLLSPSLVTVTVSGEFTHVYRSPMTSLILAGIAELSRDPVACDKSLCPPSCLKVRWSGH